MDSEERLIVRILIIVRKFDANNAGSLEWHKFCEEFRKEYGVISERELWDHVSHARELDLLRAGLIEGRSFDGQRLYGGTIDALTSQGNKYIRDYRLNYARWFGPRFERIIWIFVAAIVGILAAKLF